MSASGNDRVRRIENGPYARSARLYLEKGWYPLPVLDGGKGLVPTGLTGYNAKKVTDEDIARWVNEQGLGGSNVCLRLFYEVGIDIDSYDPTKQAREAWDGLCRRHGEPPPTVRVSARFGEGYDGLAGIRIYRLPREYWRRVEQRVWNSQLGSGIDLIRLGHRQVVVWPSVHPKLGTTYQWMDERTGEIHDGPLPPADTLPELPDMWIDQVLMKKDGRAKDNRGTRANLSARGSEGSIYWTAGKPCGAVQACLGKAQRELENGRHDCVLKHMTALTRLGEQGHSGVLKAIDTLHGGFLLSTEGEDRDVEGEWDRMAAGVDAVIESDGLTPEGEKGCCLESEEAQDWPPIVEITQGVSQPFPVDALPVGMREAVEEVARTRMVDPAIPGAAFLGAAAGALGAHLAIRINSSWTTGGNLYMAVIAETGDGKTPGTAPALAPLQEIEEKLREKARESKRNARTQLPPLQDELKGLTAKNSAKNSANTKRIMQLQRQIEKYEEDLHRDPRLVVDDVTPERLAEILHDNDGRIVAFNDEGALFAHLLGLYASNPNLGPFLKAWDGSRLTMDRKGGNGKERTALVIPHPLMTMFAAVQPRIVVQLGEQRHQLLRERGVIGRVLFVWPAPMAGHRTLRGQPHEVRLEKVDAWSRVIAKSASELEDTFLSFTSEAYNHFVDWHDRVEALLPNGELYADIKDFVVKIREQVARIAGLFAFLEHDPDEDIEWSTGIPVRVDHVSRAIELGEYFLQGAFAVVESWQGLPVGLARRLIAKIRKDGGQTFTVREACRWTKAKKDALLPALDLLQHHGFVRPADPGKGFGRLDDRQIGQVSPTVLANPALWNE